MHYLALTRTSSSFLRYVICSKLSLFVPKSVILYQAFPSQLLPRGKLLAKNAAISLEARDSVMSRLGRCTNTLGFSAIHGLFMPITNSQSHTLSILSSSTEVFFLNWSFLPKFRPALTSTILGDKILEGNMWSDVSFLSWMITWSAWGSLNALHRSCLLPFLISPICYLLQAFWHPSIWDFFQTGYF